MTTICSNPGVDSPKYDAGVELMYGMYGMRLEQEEQEDIDDIETLKEGQRQREANKKRPKQGETDQNSEERKLTVSCLHFRP